METTIRLKEWREKNGISQERLAAKCGLSRKTVADIENGENVNPTLDTLLKIAAAMDITLTDLFITP